MTKVEKALIKEYNRIFTDREYAFSRLLKIEDKEGDLISFNLWENQKKFLKYKRFCQESKGRWSMFCPKVRQGGITVVAMGDNTIDSVLHNNKSSLYIIKDGESCEPLFKKLRVMDKHIPNDFQQEKISDQIRTIHYAGTNSQIRITESGVSLKQTDKKGRSGTAQYLHVTEAAYIEHLAALMRGARGSVSPNGCIVYESTMNGPQGAFYDKCMSISTKGEKLEENVWVLGNEIVLFLPFYDHPEYREAVKDDWRPEGEEEEKMFAAGVPKEAIQYRRRWQQELPDDKRTGLTADLAAKRELPWTMEEGFEASGKTIFDIKQLKLLHEMEKVKARESVTVGLLNVNGKMEFCTPTPKNEFKIWKVPEYNINDRYLVGADCGEGLENSDPDCIYVKDRITGEIVAMAHGIHGAEHQVPMMINLAIFYDNAWVSWDRSGCGADRLPFFQIAKYPNLFSFKEVDNIFDHPEGLGLRWNGPNKIQACSLMRVRLEDGSTKIYDLGFYEEAKSFGFNDKGEGPAGLFGVPDDRVMTLALISYVENYLPVPTRKREEEEPKYMNKISKLKHASLNQEGSKGLTNWD